jgi:hypothetical protein
MNAHHYKPTPNRNKSFQAKRKPVQKPTVISVLKDYSTYMYEFILVFAWKDTLILNEKRVLDYVNRCIQLQSVSVS